MGITPTSKCSPRLTLHSRFVIHELVREKVEIKTFSENKKDIFLKVKRSKVNRIARSTG